MRYAAILKVRVDARTLERINRLAVRLGISRRRWTECGLKILAEASELAWNFGPLLADLEDFVQSVPLDWIGKTGRKRNRKERRR